MLIKKDVSWSEHRRRLHTFTVLHILILLRGLFLSMFIDEGLSLPSPPPLPQTLHFSHSGAACMQHLVSAVAVAPAQHRAQGCKFPTQTQWCNTTDRHRMQKNWRKLFRGLVYLLIYLSTLPCEIAHNARVINCHRWSLFAGFRFNFNYLSLFLLSCLSAPEKSFSWRLTEATSARSILLWRAAAGGLCVSVSHPQEQQHSTVPRERPGQHLCQASSAESQHQVQQSSTHAKRGSGNCRSRPAGWLPWRWQALQAWRVWGKPPGDGTGAGEGWWGETCRLFFIAGWLSHLLISWLCDVNISF